MGLKEFLVSAKAGLKVIQSLPRIHVVIGNESCDLDSTISAITYAYFLHQTKPSPETFYLPVLAIPREKFRLRLEIVYFLSKHDIAAENLVFVDDLDLVELTQNEVITLSVTLVDHHELAKAEQCLRNFVVEVLDHRPQVGVLPESWNAQIERVGSCSTLVARKIFASADFILDSTLAELLLGTILMDTGNMSASDGVGTPTDQEMLVKLKSFLPPDSAGSIYEGIRNAKSDLSSLTVLEILYKDLKLLQGTHITVAMSSVTMKLEDILSRPEFSHDCEEFCSALPADVLIIITLWRDDTGLSQRRIAVYSLNRIYREQISDVLLNSVSPNLELQPLTSYNHLEHLSAFIQNNIQIFRKGVIPLIRDFLAGENTTLDENLNAFDNILQPYSDSQVEFGSPGEKGDTSEEEARKHINLAKAFQSEQFRTSQDRYDLAAVGMDPVISPSLSSDSELSSSTDKQREDNDVVGEKNKVVDTENSEFTGAYVGVKTDAVTFVNETGAGDGKGMDALVALDAKDVSVTGDGAFVNNLIEFGFDSDSGISHVAGVNLPQTNVISDFTDVLGSDSDVAIMNNSFGISEIPADNNILSPSALDIEVTGSKEIVADLFGTRNDFVTVDSVVIDAQDEKHLDGDDHGPFNLLYLDNADSPLDFSSMPTSNQTSGQGSKIPSYPDTPPNSYMESSNVPLNKETQLPSFNSSEMVKRIQEKKAALAGHSGKQKKSKVFDDEEIVEELFLGDGNSSGGSGSLISPAVPQNSYVDLISGFDFQSSDQKLPKLMNSDIMERVNEKRSQFEWSIESLDGSTSGVDVGPNSEEGAQKSQFCVDGVQHIPVNLGADPQVPYTPQNSYVDEQFDSYARSNLPSLNNAEIVAKIKAKQSAMFGSGSSSRVSRSSHGSDDSGGCRSPDVVEKSPRGASLDSPQAPYTPQNSYRDNLGILESRNHLSDLNEVAERLTTENALKHQFGKRSTSNSGGGSRDEENVNLNTHQPSHRRYGRNSSSQSDSQNTMSDVESLMSVSTDIGTPSENIVATSIANQMRSEIALLSRKDTNDSDVFPVKTEEWASVIDLIQPKVGHIDLVTPEKMSNSNVPEKNPDRSSVDNSEDVVRNGYAGAKELFSPFDSNKVNSIEDEALIQAAESIVAMSVAAAIEVSQRDVEAEELRKESRLRWDDNVESVSHNNNNTEIVNKIYVVDDDGSGDDSTTGDISESLPDNDLEKVVGQNGNLADNVLSQNIAEEMFAESVSDPVLNSQSQQERHHLLDEGEFNEANQEAPQDVAYRNSVPQNELLLFSESDLDLSVPSHQVDADTGLSVPSHQVDAEAVTVGEQNLADLALNELAFELANELIHSVLDDFPFSYDSEDTAEVHADDGVVEVEQEKVETGSEDVQETATKIVHTIGLDNTLASERMNVATLNVSGNNENAVSSVEIQADQDEKDFDLTDGNVPRSAEEISSSSTGSTVEKDFKHPMTILDSNKFDTSVDSNSSSSSSERKRSRETDLSMTIMENEIMATFPERKTSAEFTAAEEEEEIKSFPGRKFSKSEDYPNRRFSRDENASRRSSRFDDLDLEVTIGPEDIETDYLPNMDPLQGNLDIIDASFSKMTDADREVVEGESFRKASGEDFISVSDEGDKDEYDGDDTDGSKRRLEEEDYFNNITGTFDTNGSHIVGVDELVSKEESDIRNGNFSEEVREKLNEVEAFANISSELASKNSDMLEIHLEDFPSQTELPFTEDSDELEMQDEDNEDSDELEMQDEVNFSQNGLLVADVSNEVKGQDVDNSKAEVVQDSVITQDADDFNKTQRHAKDNADILELWVTNKSSEFEKQLAETSNEQETHPAEISNEQEIQPAETSNEQETHPAETSNEQDIQPAETSNELEIQPSEIFNEQEIQPAEIFNQLKIQPAEIFTEPNSAEYDNRIEQEKTALVEEMKIPKQKKKIRVSFSEDFDDELGDFNITSSSRSPLKSPPPLPSSEDSGSSGSSPVNFNSTAADEDRVSPSSAATTQWTPDEHLPRKEVYHTSAGRISIAMGEEEYSRNFAALNSGVSAQGSSYRDQIRDKERAQTGEMIESAEGTISEADHRLEIFDVPAHTSSAFDHDSLDFSQSDLSSHALHASRDVSITSEHESDNAFNIVTSDHNVATFDSWNSDLNAVNYNLMTEASVISVTNSYNQDINSEPSEPCAETSEPCAITSDSLTFSQQQTVPAILTLSTLEPLTSNPFISLPTHVRSLSSASTGSVQAAVYSDEWQDDDIVDVAAQSGLEVSADDALRKKIVPDSSFAEAALPDNGLEREEEENEDNKEVDEDSDAGDLEWENDTPVKTPARPGIEPTLTEESTSQVMQRWKRVSISGSEFDIDMQAVEPYRNVLSHGGYYDEGLSAIIVFYGCNLPSHHCQDYAYIMNHLFHYVIHTLEELVADDYVIIYFHGSTPRRQMPSLGWLKRCYQSIDRRLKKNLKGLFLVHPTLWLRTIVMMTKPFISTKFSSKLRFVRTLEELNALVPLNNVSIPVAVVHYDIHHQHLPTPTASPSHSPSL